MKTFNALIQLVTVGILILLSGCASIVTDYRTTAEGEEVFYKGMRTKVAPGLMRAPQSPGLVALYKAANFIKADSPNATIELDWAWGLAPETELGRRFKPLMPKEWAEYVVAKRTDRIAKAHGVVTNSTYETLTWQGLPGYKVTIDYTTVLGLDSRIVTYGAVYKEDMYIITMRADLVENYDSMLPKFEYMAKNVTFDK